MNLAIIAAGEGSRLKAEGVPGSKPLVNIGGVPMIERLISHAAACGIRRYCCIVNEDSADLKEFLLSRKLPLDGRVVVRSTPSSMHSLFALAPMLRDGPFCLATADAIFREAEFRAYLEAAAARRDSDGVLAITGYIHDEKPLCVQLDDSGRIVAFSDSAEGCRWATGGLYYFSPRIFDCMEEALRSGTTRLRNFLRLLLQRSYRLHGFAFSKIVDVDHVGDIADAEELLEAELTHPRGASPGIPPRRPGA